MIYDCNTHSCLWYFNFIAIPSFVSPKLACIELLISLHNDRHLFADGFAIVRPIAMRFRWDKENASCLKFRKFRLNPTNFNRKLTMVFKLDLKKIILTAFRSPVQNGFMQKVNIFCTENQHLNAFYAPNKNRTNWMRASCWFLFLKKSAITFGEGCTIDVRTSVLIHINQLACLASFNILATAQGFSSSFALTWSAYWSTQSPTTHMTTFPVLNVEQFWFRWRQATSHYLNQ